MQKTPEHINEICMDLLNMFWTIQIIITSICVWWWHMQKMRHSNIPTDWQLVNTDRGKRDQSNDCCFLCFYCSADPMPTKSTKLLHSDYEKLEWKNLLNQWMDEINTFYSEIHIAHFWNLARLSSSCVLYVLPLPNTVSIEKKLK